MQFTAKRPVTMQASHIRIVLAPCPDEFKLLPGRIPGTPCWQATIDLETGKIEEWTEAAGAADLCIKVCDSGKYSLMQKLDDGTYKPICSLSWYVPIGILPGKDDDYLEFEVSPDGIICDWVKPDGQDLANFCENSETIFHDRGI